MTCSVTTLNITADTTIITADNTLLTTDIDALSQLPSPGHHPLRRVEPRLDRGAFIFPPLADRDALTTDDGSSFITDDIGNFILAR